MRLKVTSSGTPRGLKVCDAESGKQLEGFHRAEVFAEAGQIPLIKLTFVLDSMECVSGVEPEPPTIVFKDVKE